MKVLGRTLVVDGVNSEISHLFKAGLICTLLSVISLALCVQYLYIPQRDNFQTGECTITACYVITDICGSNNHKYACYQTIIEFGITVDDVYCSAVEDPYSDSDYGDALEECAEYAVGSTIECYYDIRDVCDSLDDQHTDVMAGGIAGVTIFTILLAISIGVVCFIAICMYNPRFEQELPQ